MLGQTERTIDPDLLNLDGGLFRDSLLGAPVAQGAVPPPPVVSPVAQAGRPEHPAPVEVQERLTPVVWLEELDPVDIKLDDDIEDRVTPVVYYDLSTVDSQPRATLMPEISAQAKEQSRSSIVPERPAAVTIQEQARVSAAPERARVSAAPERERVSAAPERPSPAIDPAIDIEDRVTPVMPPPQRAQLESVDRITPVVMMSRQSEVPVSTSWIISRIALGVACLATGAALGLAFFGPRAEHPESTTATAPVEPAANPTPVVDTEGMAPIAAPESTAPESTAPESTAAEAPSQGASPQAESPESAAPQAASPQEPVTQGPESALVAPSRGTAAPPAENAAIARTPAPAKAPATSNAAPSAGSSLLGELDEAKPFQRAAAAIAIGAAARAARSCVPAGEAGGSTPLRVVYAPSGRVTSATVQGGPFAGTYAGNCIARTLRGASITPFDGSAQAVTMTVRIP